MKRTLPAAAGILLAIGVILAWAGPDTGTTKFTNQDSIVNTRHNLTQAPLGSGSTLMDTSRNQYGEVCVYCHTPHGAANVAIPLWNRTIRATSYTTYNQLQTSTITQPVSQPGSNSIACLTCHDGQTAIDSVINMPGSGRYNANQATAQDNAFLNSWPNPGGNQASHTVLGSETGSDVGCMACHGQGPVGGLFPTATDFRGFVVGTDLRNDHPVGVRFPTNAGSGNDFNAPSSTTGPIRWFDRNGNGRADKDEIRLFDTGEGFEVECATCHDPHGVTLSGGQSGALLPSFLRVDNAGSRVCLTCHNK